MKAHFAAVLLLAAQTIVCIAEETDETPIAVRAEVISCGG